MSKYKKLPKDFIADNFAEGLVRALSSMLVTMHQGHLPDGLTTPIQMRDLIQLVNGFSIGFISMMEVSKFEITDEVKMKTSQYATKIQLGFMNAVIRAVPEVVDQQFIDVTKEHEIPEELAEIGDQMFAHAISILKKLLADTDNEKNND